MSDTSHQPPAAEDNVDDKLAEIFALALPPTVAVLAVAAGYIQGPPMAVLVLAAGALVATVAFFWSSLRAMFGETRLSGEDAFAMAAPSAEEEKKRAVLRALKDIAFEHSIGKLSDADYKALNARYRAEAKRLLRVLDHRAAPTRKQAEALAKAYLVDVGVVRAGDPAWAESPDSAAAESGGPAAAAAGPPEAAESSASPASVRAAELVPTRVCPSCGTINDGDALFCKKCGGRFEQEMMA